FDTLSAPAYVTFHLFSYCHILSDLSLSTSFFFFFSSSGHHLDLHSFPTRRSSDLFSTLPGIIRPLLSSGLLVGILLALVLENALDRKSTRLNSSHVSISYAVFCLKKKKKISVIFHTDYIDRDGNIKCSNYTKNWTD